ncbi:hypothetical protein D9M68_829620 [compost metagenome]
MKLRKKSTVCTMALPGGTRTTAASSGACSPISTSSRCTGCSCPKARLRMLAPTLAPQPPQRMAIAEMACCDSSALSTRLLAGAADGVAPGAISGSSVNLRMKRRSIQSFQVQTQFPAKPMAPREATA